MLFYKLFTLVGIGILTFQFIVGRELWGDEAMLVNNIIERSFLELLQPMDDFQVAPIGYLMIQKLLIIMFGNGEWVFRCVSYLSLIGSIVLIPKLFRALAIPTENAWFSMSLLAILPATMIYGTEIKPYSCELLFGILVLINNRRIVSNSIREVIRFTLLVFVSILFSHATYFVLTGVVLYLLAELLQNGNISNIWKIFIPMLPLIFHYYLIAFDHPSKDHMMHFLADYFLVINSFEDVLLKSRGIAYEIFGRLGLLGVHYWIPSIVALGGFIYVVYKSRWLPLIIMPFVVLLIASALGLYSYVSRLIFFCLPGIIYLLTKGWMLIVGRLLQSSKLRSLLVIVPLGLWFVITVKQVPFERLQIRTALRYVESIPAAKVIVYPHPRSVYEYYLEKRGMCDGMNIQFGNGMEDLNLFLTSENFTFESETHLIIADQYKFPKILDSLAVKLEFMGVRITDQKDFKAVHVLKLVK